MNKNIKIVIFITFNKIIKSVARIWGKKKTNQQKKSQTTPTTFQNKS